MEKRELRLDYSIYENSYPEDYQALCEEAVAVTGNAYSVYSCFSVGAAVLLDDGTVVTGSNQENMAYPSGVCAERTALFYAGSTYPATGVKAIAIAAKNKGRLTGNFTPPCGACRQVMSEVIRRYGKDFDVIMVGQKESIVLKASALLPFSFNL